jgi:F420-non-reducing hydrogenase small subunit
MDNPDHVRPTSATTVAEGVLHLPALEGLLATLDQVVEVDYRVPGCPPETERIAEVLGLLGAALDGKATLPARGSVLGAGQSTVCDECRRDRGIKHIARFGRLHELPPLDPSLCLLEQGVPCNGPATRSGCVARCPLAGAPCIGCYGPADGVVDFGARLLSAFASVVDADEAAEIDRILDGLPDPVGQFYRFSLAGSLLRGSRSVRTGPASSVSPTAEAAPELAPVAAPAPAPVAAPELATAGARR